MVNSGFLNLKIESPESGLLIILPDSSQCDVELLDTSSYSPVPSPETIEILDESTENESEDAMNETGNVVNESEDVENESDEQLQMTSTSTEVIDGSRFSSVCLRSENNTEMPESSNNLEEQVSSTACLTQSLLTTEFAVDQTVNDLGALLLPSKTIAEITTTMSKLSNSQRYSLLYNHMSPPNVLPTSYSYGCNRKFNTTWLYKYAWLRYSPKLDGVFCGPCAVFAGENRMDKGILVNRPFSNWVKITETLSKYAKLAYHHKALQDADVLKNVIENPKSRIDILSSSVLQCRMKENKHIFGQIVCAILYLTKQGLAL